jgi:hypothetical protein
LISSGVMNAAIFSVSLRTSLTRGDAELASNHSCADIFVVPEPTNWSEGGPRWSPAPWGC